MTAVTEPRKLPPATTVGSLLAGFYVCDSCKWPNVAIGGYSISSIPTRFEQESSEDIRWYPESAVGRTFEDVPEFIADAADEAFRCQSFGAYKSAILMSRSVIEATCKEKGIISGSLMKKIDDLSSQGFVRSHTGEAAHEIRFFGNDMAHGDFVDPVSSDECSEVLDLMAEFLNEVFQSPAKVARVRESRKKRIEGKN